MSKEKISPLTELREVIKKDGKEKTVNQLSFRLQKLLEEELDVKPLNIPQFTIIKKIFQS